MHEQRSQPGRRWADWAGRPRFWMGLALLIGAGGAAWAMAGWPDQVSPLDGRILLVALLVAVNLGLTALLLWLMVLSLSPRPRPGLGRMWLVVCLSEWLAWIPLAGFAGRAGLLKKLHGVSIRGSVWTGAVTLGLGLIVALIALGVWLAVKRGGLGELAILATALALVGVLSILTGRATGPLRPGQERAGPLFHPMAWLPLRLSDAAVHGLRWWLVLGMVGASISIPAAMMIASTGLLVRMLKLTPGGLGIREWTLGALTVAAGSIDPGLALTAAVIDRIIELPVTLAAGYLGMRRLGRGSDAAQAEPAGGDDDQAEEVPGV
ncbi:MAG: hypothetical protein JJU36_15365 [Phycisphaeraceae bacterium]|nr:hypothetical protein [Phycisphaeraceae bacterium]